MCATYVGTDPEIVWEVPTMRAKSAIKKLKPKTGILDDYVELEDFAAEVNRTPRTVDGWTKQANGLPFVQYGYLKLLHVPTTRDWLLGRLRQPNKRAP
jgi:hypothetical protein